MAALAFTLGCSGTAGENDGGAGGGTSHSTGGGSGGSGGGGTGGGAMPADSGSPDAGGMTSDGGFFGASRCPNSNFVVCDDFEGSTIDSAVWVPDTQAGTVTIDSTRFARGSKSLHAKLTGSGGGNATLRFKQKVPIAGQRHWGRMFVYVPMSASGFLMDHSNLVNASGNNSSGSLSAYVAAIGAGVLNGIFFQQSPGIDETSLLYHQGVTRTPVPLDRWFCLEWDFNGADKALTLFLDGDLIPTSVISGRDAPTMADVRIGIQFVLPEAWFDSVAFASTRVGCSN